MKKQVIFITFFLLLSIVSFGQGSTYLSPFPGFKHTYNATVTDAGSNNPVRWFVTTDSDGKNLAVYDTDYSFATAGQTISGGVLSGSAVYSVEINWLASITKGAYYYVFIEVDDNSSNCTNRMGLRVQVSADFNLAAYDVTTASDPTDSADPNITTESCPFDPENPVWNSTTSGHTDIGYSELIFLVERQFSALAWQFEYEISEGTGQSFTVESISMKAESGTTVYTGTDLTETVASIGSSEDYVLAYVRVTNQQGITLDINFDLINGNSLSKDSGNNLDSNVGDNSADHTLKPMPAITGFDGN